MAVSTTRALTKQYFDMVGSKDTENSHWPQNLFRLMGFICRTAIRSKPHIPEDARKEKELMFFYLIAENVEECLMPNSFICNFNQIQPKSFPVSSRPLAWQNSEQVHTAGGSGKCSMTAMFRIL